MSDNIPFEIQVEIIKRLPVKSLVQFRTVSKAWKSFIDSSHFISHYSSQVQYLFIKYETESDYMKKYVSIADDDTFPHQKVFPTVPLFVSMLRSVITIIGCSQGLICLFGSYPKDLMSPPTKVAVLWNLCIGKAVPIIVPYVVNPEYETVVGFGVCRETSDPKIIKIIYINSGRDIEVEVFTLSTKSWRRPCGNFNFSNKSIRFGWNQVVANGCLYFLASDCGLRFYNMIISFDLTSEEFREINLPDSLSGQLRANVSMYKLRESLVVVGRGKDADDHVFNVWMMKDGVLKSFSKLFTFNVTALDTIVRGFRGSGEPIIEISKDHIFYKLVVYEHYSKQINTLGIERLFLTYSVHPYMETLLLLDQPNFSEEEIRKYLHDLAS